MSLDTYNSFSSGKFIDVDSHFDIRVNLHHVDVDILAGDLLGFLLDQLDPLLPQPGGGLVHLRVAVLQVLGDSRVDNLTSYYIIIKSHKQTKAR